MPVVLLSSKAASESSHTNTNSYPAFVAEGQAISRGALEEAEGKVRCDDIVNLQFTSGKQDCGRLTVVEFDSDRHYRGSQSSHVKSQVNIPDLAV